MRFLLPLLALLAACAFAQTDSALSGLATLKPFEAERASSSAPDWRDSNWDARGIAPGETLVLADLTGPGNIAHIWCTISHNVEFSSRLLTLRMYWDGEESPSVEVPIGDFFGVGHGVDVNANSAPIRCTADGKAKNCYWPMPFGKSARITVTNDSTVAVGAFYWQIDWQKYATLPADAACFHAMYRQEFPCVMGRNYLLADIVGRGHYVGTVESVYQMSGSWFGEGDDFWFIDGEAEPRIRGTGTEDYFNDAWGFRESNGPYYGIPLWEGFEAGDKGSAYRWHIADPVPFTKSLRVEIEHKGWQNFPDGKADGHIERDDLFSSVAFWYQTEPHKPYESLPLGPQRLPYREEPVVEGETTIAFAAHSEGPSDAQDLGECSGGKQLFFRPAEAGAWLEVPFTLDQPITADLRLRMIHSYDYGTYRVLLDGQDVGTFDLYAPSIKLVAHRLGMRALAAGPHSLRFECTAKPANSTGVYLGFDALVQRKTPYQRPEGKDLRDLQAR